VPVALALLVQWERNAKSRIFYNRVKGEVEEALAQLSFDGVVITRPSLLRGDRDALGQPKRPAEKVVTLPQHSTS
jgi:uncharacterized protein YbjT (DUF2867 family)